MSASDESPSEQPPGRRYKPQAYYLPVDLHERLKAAWWATRDKEPPDGAGSMNLIVERLLEEECARLEQKYNEGKPFPPAPKKARGVSGAGTQRQRAYMEEYWANRRESGAGDGDRTG